MMTRRAAVSLSCAGLAVLLVSCAAASPSPGDARRGGSEPAGTVTVFAAASLTETFDALAREFESEHPGVEVVLNYGGSSGLAAQLVEGAAADVFAAASEATMATVVEAGLVVEPRAFASNALELVVPRGNPAGVRGLADLARPELLVALCDPSVPCGAAAEELLALAGVAASPDTLEQDVKAVATKVALGEVDAGLVYATDARAAGDALESIPVVGADRVVTRYVIGRLGASGHPEAAEAWIAWVEGARGGEVLRDAGFGSP